MQPPTTGDAARQVICIRNLRLERRRRNPQKMDADSLHLMASCLQVKRALSPVFSRETNGWLRAATLVCWLVGAERVATAQPVVMETAVQLMRRRQKATLFAIGRTPLAGLRRIGSRPGRGSATRPVLSTSQAPAGSACCWTRSPSLTTEAGCGNSPPATTRSAFRRRRRCRTRTTWLVELPLDGVGGGLAGKRTSRTGRAGGGAEVGGRWAARPNGGESRVNWGVTSH